MEYDGDAISDSEWFAAECEDRDDDEPEQPGTESDAPEKQED